MSFTLDMTQVYQQFIDVFTSLEPLIFPFVGVLLALFVVGGLFAIFRRQQNG